VPASPDVDAWPWPIKIYALAGSSVEGGRGDPLRRKTQKKPLLELLQAQIAYGGTDVAVSVDRIALARCRG
jgi:hypothetical protein